MLTVSSSKISPEERKHLTRAVKALGNALNHVSNPRVAAVLTTPTGVYTGVNVFLSNCTVICAEAAALSACTAAGDPHPRAIYLVADRKDGSESQILTPCGTCRQMLRDYAALSGIIRVYATTRGMERVQITDSEELLPAPFVPRPGL
jgi:cytidine deaminase